MEKELTQFEAFQKVYDMITLLYSKGLAYMDSLEYRANEEKFVYWGNCYRLDENNKETPVGFHYKTQYFAIQDLQNQELNDDKCSQVLIMKKYEVLANIITSKDFTKYVANQMLNKLEDQFIKETPINGKD